MGMVIAPSINTGTFGVAPKDAGVASATVNVGQQLGASVGTSFLNTIFAGAVTSYLVGHLGSASQRGSVTRLALAHGYDRTFWWVAGIFGTGAIVGAVLLRPGPLVPATVEPVTQDVQTERLTASSEASSSEIQQSVVTDQP
jgi:hypothetical protein